MKKEMISNMLSGNEIYHRKMEYTCGICKSDKLPDNIVIFITYNSSSSYKLNENIASLVMHM